MCKCVTVRGVPLQGVAAHWNYLCTALCLISAPDRCISRTFQFFFPAWSGKHSGMRREHGGSPALAVVLSNLGITVLWPVVPPYLPLQLPSSSRPARRACLSVLHAQKLEGTTWKYLAALRGESVLPGRYLVTFSLASSLDFVATGQPLPTHPTLHPLV